MLALELKKKCLLLNRLVSSYEKEFLILSSLRFFTKKKTCQLDREAFNWSRIKTQTCKKVLCIYCATLKSEATLQDFSFPNGGAFLLPKLFRRFQTDATYLYIYDQFVHELNPSSFLLVGGHIMTWDSLLRYTLSN